MIFIFRNRTIFWDISKWNRGQKKWNGGNISLNLFYQKEKRKKRKEKKTTLEIDMY